MLQNNKPHENMAQPLTLFISAGHSKVICHRDLMHGAYLRFKTYVFSVDIANIGHQLRQYNTEL